MGAEFWIREKALGTAMKIICRSVHIVLKNAHPNMMCSRFGVHAILSARNFECAKRNELIGRKLKGGRKPNAQVRTYFCCSVT